MRGLFGDVVATSLVWIVPIAGESLAEDRIQGLLHTTRLVSVEMLEVLEVEYGIRRLYMPATEVEFDHSNKAI